MKSRHPDIELLIAAERGEVPPREVRRLRRRHLDAECGGCELRTSVFEAFLRDDVRTDPAARGRAYAAVADGTVDLATAFALDRPAVERELETLRALAPERRATRVRRAVWPRYRSPLLVEALIEEARGRLRQRPREALPWLVTAGAAASRAERDLARPEDYAPLRDLRLRIRAHEGNALRVLGDLRAADWAFAAVRKRLDEGEAPALAVAAELASLEASLRYDQRRLAEADALLERAEPLYRWAENEAGLAKVLTQRGMVLYVSGEPERAIPCYERAAAVVTPEADPELAIAPRHNLVLCLCDTGQADHARRVLDEYRPLYLRLSLPVAPLWLAWAEGKVAAALDDDEEAVEHLRAARDGYAGRELEFDAALVGLDLAEVHLRRGETAEVKRLAERTVAAFAEREVDPEAERAAALFARAAVAEAVTAEIIARTRRALLFARARPRPRS